MPMARCLPKQIKSAQARRYCTVVISNFSNSAAQFDFPLLMMGYYNPVLQMGITLFLERLREAEVRVHSAIIPI
jgi:tryptophan synthase alpha subunit